MIQRNWELAFNVSKKMLSKPPKYVRVIKCFVWGIMWKPCENSTTMPFRLPKHNMPWKIAVTLLTRSFSYGGSAFSSKRVKWGTEINLKKYTQIPEKIQLYYWFFTIDEYMVHLLLYFEFLGNDQELFKKTRLKNLRQCVTKYLLALLLNRI